MLIKAMIDNKHNFLCTNTLLRHTHSAPCQASLCCLAGCYGNITLLHSRLLWKHHFVAQQVATETLPLKHMPKIGVKLTEFHKKVNNSYINQSCSENKSLTPPLFPNMVNMVRPYKDRILSRTNMELLRSLSCITRFFFIHPQNGTPYFWSNKYSRMKNVTNELFVRDVENISGKECSAVSQPAVSNSLFDPYWQKVTNQSLLPEYNTPNTLPPTKHCIW